MKPLNLKLFGTSSNNKCVCFRWMQYGNVDKNYMSHREFSFTLEDDIYLRYLSFSNQEEFEAEMIKKCPHKIDIGAVYNARPSDHKKLTNFTPQERELGTYR